MTKKQKTIATDITVKGRGLHTGKFATLVLKPAPENHGIVFQRIDLPEKPLVKAHISNVFDTSRSTNLRDNNADIKTVEHLLSALAGLSIDNLLIEIDNDEVPILDGSATEYVEKLMAAGFVEQNAPREYFTVTEVVKFEKPDKGIELLLVPSKHEKYTVMVDYGTHVLASQCATLKN